MAARCSSSGLGLVWIQSVLAACRAPLGLMVVLMARRMMLKGYGPTLTVRSRLGLSDCSSLRCAPGHAWNPQTWGSGRCGESFTGTV